ncbi:rhomboid family intramembrane serine protease [Bordetella sp. LUAb4]|uniref:rhomboid family intramembrane serine protease n=1 Tax=Bordetella sp. LUAb4 TaxID=2843195 RepID=UPI001E59698E|nr:rhomboid family intramembrane serine protease [Bordetella sp. LUAb4]
MPSPGRTPLFFVLRASKITILLVIANIAVYAGLGLLDTRAFESLSQSSFLIDWGANVPPLTLSGEYWRLFTSMFLHVGFAHLAMNMLALWSLGIVLEARMRWPVFLGIYLLSGLWGSLTTALWNQDVLMISCGASGAILGLFGAALAYALADRNSGRAHFPMKNLVMSLVLTFAAGTVFSIDNAAHLGGLAAGFVLALVARYCEDLRPGRAAGILLLTAIVAAAALAGVFLDRQDKDMSDKLAIARLHATLRHIGLGEPAYALDGAPMLDGCIAGVLQNGEADSGLTPAQAAAKVSPQALHQCAESGESRLELLARFLPREYAKCQAQAADLRARVTQAPIQKGLEVIEHYCATRPPVYQAVFAEAPQGLDLPAVARARTAVEELLNGNAPDSPDRTYGEPLTIDDEYPSYATVTLLNSAGEMATGVVEESGCPYWSCKR